MKSTTVRRGTDQGRSATVPALLADVVRLGVLALVAASVSASAAAQGSGATGVLAQDTMLPVEEGRYGQVLFQAGSTVVLGPTGAVAQGTLGRDTMLAPGGPNYSNSYGNVLFKAGGLVVFGSAGSATQGTLARDTMLPVNGVNGNARNFLFAAGTTVRFVDGGRVAFGTLAAAAPVMLGANSTRELAAGTVVSFGADYAAIIAAPVAPGAGGGSGSPAPGPPAAGGTDPTGGPGNPTTDQRGVFGKWHVHLNGQPSVLEIGGTPGSMTGRLGAGGGSGEVLEAVSLGAGTSTLRFARPIGGGLYQLYTGVLDGGRLSGFLEMGRLEAGFEQGSYRWTWSGERPAP